MQAVTNAGTFRVTLLSSGVGQTRNEYPQLILKVACTHLFNEQEKTWDDWTEYDQGQTGYLTLMGKDKKTQKLTTLFSFDDAKAVFGWDGKSYVKLQQILEEKNDAGDFQFQARFVEDDYEDAKFEMKLASIAPADADPVREIKALDVDGLKNLDKMCAVAMKAAASKEAPAATKKKKKTKKTTKPTVPPTSKVNNPASLKERNEAENEKIAQMHEEGTARAEQKVADRAAAKNGPPKPPAPPKPSKEPGCSKEEYWEAITNHVAGVDTLTDDDASTAYLEGIYEVVGEVTDETIDEVTPQQWHLCKEAALKKLSAL